MKICPNCKNEYADSVAICPADGTILDLDIPENVSEPETAATHPDAVPHVAETVDRIGTAAAETFERDAWISGTIGDRVSTADFSRIDELIDDDYTENPFYSWLAPLIIVILLIILGYWMCGKSAAPTAAMPEANRNYIENKLI
jgi:hypothetical protein